jgi:hypothetical protein
MLVFIMEGLAFAGLLTAASAGATGQARRFTSSEVSLRSNLRKLWEEHIVYTRTFIISALAGLPDADSTAQRLLRNQHVLGAAMKPFYGEEAGAKLASLLREHILIAAEIIKSAKAADADGVAKGQAAWHANAEDIAAFLSSANPNWQKGTLSEMLNMHLVHTTTEVASRLKGDWAADIQVYDQGHEHMLKFSDLLADGIVKQFPARFKK